MSVIAFSASENWLSYLSVQLKQIGLNKWWKEWMLTLINFDYYKLTPKDKPVKYQFTFSGSGILNLRTNFRTDRFLERLGKL